jgi:hypothetical protein
MREQIRRRFKDNHVKILSSQKDSLYNTDNAFKIKCLKVLDILSKEPDSAAKVEFCCKPLNPS